MRVLASVSRQEEGIIGILLFRQLMWHYGLLGLLSIWNSNRFVHLFYLQREELASIWIERSIYHKYSITTGVQMRKAHLTGVTWAFLLNSAGFKWRAPTLACNFALSMC
jgi:hypothetical protein